MAEFSPVLKEGDILEANYWPEPIKVIATTALDVTDLDKEESTLHITLTSLIWGIPAKGINYLTFFAGLVLVVLGIGMWQSPEMDWQGFLLAWSSVIKEIGRLVHDPFAILGIFVATVGALITLRGLWGVVRGPRPGNKGGK